MNSFQKTGVEAAAAEMDLSAPVRRSASCFTTRSVTRDQSERVWFWLLSLMFLANCCLFAGCSGAASNDENASAATENGQQEKDEAIKTIPAFSLPEVSYDELPVLDDGRVEVGVPNDWKIAPNSTRYVAAFVRTKIDAPRRIIITAEECPLSGYDNLTKENVEAFAEATTALLEKRKMPLLEPAIPMILGDRAWARFVLESKLGNVKTEQQVLWTVVGGRMYVVTLEVYPNSIKQDRDVAYAVAAKMKFLPGSSEKESSEKETSTNGDAEKGASEKDASQAASAENEKDPQ